MSTSVRLHGDRVHWREVEGQVVAIDVASREYLAVNRTGAALWPLLIAGTSPEALTQALLDRFEVDEATAQRDVDALLEQLRSRELLEG